MLQLRRCATRAALALLALAPPRAIAAQSAEPQFDSLVQRFQKDYLSLGALLQVVGDFQSRRSFAGNNGFSIANMRFRLSGELDGGFGYFFQANVAATPAILDASLRYRVAPAVIAEAGLFKAPFSREFLTSAANIDFVNRSQVVTALAPGRQLGAQLRGRLAADVVEYGVGAFDGNQFGPNGNDSDALLYSARLALRPALFPAGHPSDRLEVAVNAAYSRDASATLGPGFLTGFRGTRTLAGGDFRLTRGAVLASGELVWGRLGFAGGSVARPMGWHTTGGYKPTPKSQLLFRWDAFRPDGIAPDRDLLIVAYNLWPTKPTELQVNYIIPLTVGGWSRHQLLVNSQVSF